MDQATFDAMHARFGREHAHRARWQQWLVAAFEALRPAGRRFSLRTDYRKPTLVGTVDLGECVNGVWRWHNALLRRDATEAECREVIEALFARMG